MFISSKTKADLGWEQLLEHLCRRTHTTRGHGAAQGLEFCSDLASARARIEEIAEARELMALEAPLPFGGIQDITEAVSRAEKGGVLDHGELISVAGTARGMARLRKHLDHHEEHAPRLCARAADIADLGHMYEPIADCFDASGELVDHASEDLGPLRRKLAQLQSQLEQRVRSLVDDSHIGPYLQDRYYTSREDRYVVPVRVEARSQVRGIIHGTSQSGQTVFVEPEAVVELGNRVKLAECDVRDEELRILTRLSGYVAREAALLGAGLEATTWLDVVDAGARLARDLDATAPAIDDDRGIGLIQARHPLMVLTGRPCVPNDIIIQPRAILILSGPNAGGKTVALKTAGLAALMVRAGLHVPADPGSAMPWFDAVHSDIGDSQSLENDLSTFSAHLVKLKDYLDHADERTLLLIDEIAVGTEPEQGAALGQAVLETLARRRVTAIVTTHYERLKALGATDERFANASVGFDLSTMAPTFRLHLGVPGSSGALAIARRMELPGQVLDRAEALMGERRASIEELLAQVADERRRLADERAELARSRTDADLALKQAELARDTARDHERKLKQGAHTEAVAALRRAREELDDVRSAVKRRAREGQLDQVKKRIAELASAVSEYAPERPRPSGAVATAQSVQPGTPVYVQSLGSRGRIVDAPNRGKVTVQIGNMKTAVALEDLIVESGQARGSGAGSAAGSGDRPAHKSHQPAREPHRPRIEKTSAVAPDVSAGMATGQAPDAPSVHTFVRTHESTLDVRGERADEAVDAVDRFIDQSLLSMQDVVFIIHGHGTGALRTAIRNHLAMHRAVTSWRPGERSEGGDGVTVACLDLE